MRRALGSFAVTYLCFSVTLGADAQFWARLTNPKIKINVQHPPYVALKGVTRVAISEFQGECGEELTDRLTELVSRSGKFEVLDRFNLDRMLAEQDFNFSGRVDGRSAVRLGKILGPAALIFGRVTRCRSETNNLYRKGYKGSIIYIARTRANVTASVQLVELATSRVLSAQTFDGAAEDTNESSEGRPEAPDQHELMTRAYTSLLHQVSKLILPWNETVEVLVYDDDKWNLKTGAKMMKAGDFSAAIAHFESVLGEHDDPSEKDYEKLHYKALHNLGTALTYAGRPDAAMVPFEASLRAKPQDVTSEALATARKIAGLQQAFRLQELQAVSVNTGDATTRPASSAGQAPPATGNGMQPASQPEGTKPSTTSRSAAPNSQRQRGPAKPKAEPSIEERLIQLKNLFKKGLITQDEYNEQRKALLKKLGGGG